jgi:A118 family predicted phage portal protein
MKQVVEAIGAPEAAASWSRQLQRWRHRYACRRVEVRLDLADGEHVRKRRSLGMAKRVCEDWAGLVWTENVAIDAGDDSPEQMVLDEVFDEDFSPEFMIDLEYTFALGTGALEVLVEGIPLSATGAIVGVAREVDVAYIPAECIIPLDWKRGEITEVAFVSWVSCDTVDVREHRGDSTLRTITNHRFKIVDDKLVEAPLPEGVMPQLVMADAPYPLFRCFSPAIANNVDPASPFGISVYANAHDELDACDIVFDNFFEDFDLGGKMVFVPDTMLRRSKEIDPATGKGRLIPPQKDKKNLFVAVTDVGGDASQGIKEHNPDLRVEDNKLGIETALSLLSAKVGMGEARYHFGSSGVKTATEVVSENSDLFRNRRKHLNAVTSAVTAIAHAVLWCSRHFLGLAVNPDVEIEVHTDDSVIEDDGTRQQRGMAKVAAGVLSERTYLIDYEGMTEADADAEIERINGSRTAPALFGG